MEKVEAKLRVVQVTPNNPKQAAAMFSEYIKAFAVIKTQEIVITH
jgi:hypothetical protein